MEVKIINHVDQWQAVKDAAMVTIGKEGGKYPSSEWKRNILLAEHSPIRAMHFTIRWTDIPYWVAMHLVRHKVGVEHRVSSQREDRTGEEREGKRQDEPVIYEMDANAQAIINISRKRLCAKAHARTQEAWLKALDALGEYEPELVNACVPECVYRGFCPEMQSCGFFFTEKYDDERIRYVK